MDDTGLGFALIGLMVTLIIIGLPIGITLISTGAIGVWLIRENPDLAFRFTALATYSGIQDYLFATIPLFVLMGLLVSISDVGKDTFDVAQNLLKRVKGGLGIATVGANAVFAAVTGVSIASAAVFTKVAVPEMVRHGYSMRFAAGTVAGSSILGMLIPPSLPRPTGMFRSRKRSSGAAPHASFMLLVGQWAMPAPLRATASISSSSSQTQCAITVPGRRMP